MLRRVLELARSLREAMPLLRSELDRIASESSRGRVSAISEFWNGRSREYMAVVERVRSQVEEGNNEIEHQHAASASASASASTNGNGNPNPTIPREQSLSEFSSTLFAVGGLDPLVDTVLWASPQLSKLTAEGINVCGTALSILHEVCFAVPEVGESLSLHPDILRAVFQCMKHEPLLVHAELLLEDLVCSREEGVPIVELSSSLEADIESMPPASLASFCRILMLMTLEPQPPMDPPPSLTPEPVQPLSLRLLQHRLDLCESAELGLNVHVENQTFLLSRIPSLLPRLVHLLKVGDGRPSWGALPVAEPFNPRWASIGSDADECDDEDKAYHRGAEDGDIVVVCDGGDESRKQETLGLSATSSGAGQMQTHSPTQGGGASQSEGVGRG